MVPEIGVIILYGFFLGLTINQFFPIQLFDTFSAETMTGYPGSLLRLEINRVVGLSYSSPLSLPSSVLAATCSLPEATTRRSLPTRIELIVQSLAVFDHPDTRLLLSTVLPSNVSLTDYRWAITYLAQLHPLIEPRASKLRPDIIHGDSL